MNRQRDTGMLDDVVVLIVIAGIYVAARVFDAYFR